MYYFGHIPYYLCIFLLCSVPVFPWYLIEIYTKFKNGGLVVGFAISSDSYFYNTFAGIQTKHHRIS